MSSLTWAGYRPASSADSGELLESIGLTIPSAMCAALALSISGFVSLTTGYTPSK